MSQKSYSGTPTLYLVPTPIGNLDDITLRSIKILNDVEIIFSEDTRVTQTLLNHLNIKKKLISSHKYNEVKSAENMISYLMEGSNIALVSDRGTPLISDPGNDCVKIVIEAGFNVVSLPGATALIPAITASGIKSDHFLFYGFLDSKKQKRLRELETLKNLKYTIIFYEAPHRIIETLDDICKVFGKRNASISREISKKYEEVYRGAIEIISREIICPPKGEFVIVVEENKNEYNFEDLSIIEHVNLYIKEGKTEKESFKLVAKDRNISKSTIYNEYIKSK